MDEAAPLNDAVESMHARQCATVPVVAAGRIVGPLTTDNLSEMMMANAALGSDGREAVTAPNQV